MSNQIFFNLVEASDEPIPVRFTGLNVNDFTITLKVELEDLTRISLAVSADVSDTELAFIQVTTTSFPLGKHKGRFKLVRSDTKIGRLPKGPLMIFNVGKDLE